ncbi:hypothetical protein [Chryseobacterium sp.]|uniref:tetratricopeptide repeat protein n=1 Tax=Chryseobacterium sp. TaxID=1871047 RepID=UPI00388FE14E
MKKLILGIAIVASAFAFGQKQDVNAQLAASNKAAMDAYQAKNYTVAAPKFLEVYNLLKTSGKDDKVYMYYAGLNYALANNLDESIKIYSELINSGYTGVQTNYTAKDKKGEVSSFEKPIWEGLKKSKDYTDFKEEKTPSVEPELYETLSILLLNAKKYNEAIEITEKGLAKFPANAKLKENQSIAYHNSGNTEKFTQNLKDQLAADPKNAENWYNLGVMQSKNPATVKEGIASFKKAIELKPDMSNAHQNLVYTTIGEDSKAVEEINALRKTKPDEATKLIDARKARFTEALPYAEAWYKIQPENIDVVSALKDIYGITKNDVKMKEMKAKEIELQSKGK